MNVGLEVRGGLDGGRDCLAQCMYYQSYSVVTRSDADIRLPSARLLCHVRSMGGVGGHVSSAHDSTGIRPVARLVMSSTPVRSLLEYCTCTRYRVLEYMYMYQSHVQNVPPTCGRSTDACMHDRATVVESGARARGRTSAVTRGTAGHGRAASRRAWLLGGRAPSAPARAPSRYARNPRRLEFQALGLEALGAPARTGNHGAADAESTGSPAACAYRYAYHADGACGPADAGPRRRRRHAYRRGSDAPGSVRSREPGVPLAGCGRRARAGGPCC